MKKLIIVLTILTTIISAQNISVEDIKMMVQKIRDKRVGVDIAQLAYTENPFVSVVKGGENNTTKMVFKPKRVEVQLIVDGVLNQRAKINGKWKKLGDMVSDYNITHIDSRKVILSRDNNTTKTVFIYKDKNIITSKGSN
ncbi:hypothetical protein MNB_SV-15-834 [hydrothermal vent metagenome]|uniref:Uncharacterized protein n=1 Tax=hydrothermal vent metagenome TaxID=652676 RepID=A0A1W1EK55_9ZZZZ